MLYYNRREVEIYVMDMLARKPDGCVGGVRVHYDVDSIIDAFEDVYMHALNEWQVWDVPYDLEEFWKVVNFYAYPHVTNHNTSKTGSGEFIAIYGTLGESDGDSPKETWFRMFQGTLAEIIEDCIENVQYPYGIKMYTQPGWKEHYYNENGKLVRGHEWFTDEPSDTPEITANDEAQFVCYIDCEKEKPVVLHRYPMPVTPDGVERFIKQSWNRIPLNGISERFVIFVRAV